MGQKISITKHSKRETFNLGYSRIISTANISLIFASFLMLIGISLLIYGLIQNKIKCINDFDCIDSKCIDRVCKKDNKSIKKVKTTFIVIGIIYMKNKILENVFINLRCL